MTLLKILNIMPRTYHSVNISREQQMFLKLLNDYEVEIFSISEIEKILNHSFSNLNGILENLEAKVFYHVLSGVNIVWRTSGMKM